MSKNLRRIARTQKLIKLYLQHHRRQREVLYRQARYLKYLKSTQQRSESPEDVHLLSELSSGDFNSDDSSSSSGSSSSDHWSDILGEDWRDLDLSDGSSGTSFSSDSSEDEEMPGLLPRGHRGSDSDSDSESESDTDEDGDWTGGSNSVMSGIEADDEAEEDLDEDDEDGSALLSRWVQHEVEEMYKNRYEESRMPGELPRGPSFLRHVLLNLKIGRSDHFRQALRVSPATFDKIVARIQDDPIFTNNSHHSQISVEEQLAVTLYRFGHDGNAASLQGVADWAGIGKGTVHLCTRRVMTAILRPEFMESAVRMPTPEEKEEAKAWVEAHSCKGWRNGWCFVDGTLIPLDERPFWYGESYFDRKCNYSLNIQVRWLLLFRSLCTNII